MARCLIEFLSPSDCKLFSSPLNFNWPSNGHCKKGSEWSFPKIPKPQPQQLHVRCGSMRQSSGSLRPLSTSTPGASIWPSPRQMPGPSPSPWDADQPAATTRHVVSPLTSSTHEAPSLRESGEQDQGQENEPHVHTATADAHGLYRLQISFESLSETAHWTQSPTSDSQAFSKETWYQRN